MAKKQLSFAEKAARHKGHRDWKTIKYVKSERSVKTGNWRFNESFVQLGPNENLDQALVRVQKEVNEMAKAMASVDESTVEVHTIANIDDVKIEDNSAEESETKKAETKETNITEEESVKTTEEIASELKSEQEIAVESSEVNQVESKE